jgi:siderophore synthetase component
MISFPSMKLTLLDVIWADRLKSAMNRTMSLPVLLQVRNYNAQGSSSRLSHLESLTPLTTTITFMRSERFSTKLEQIEQTHARNFLKEAVEHAILANLKPFVKHIPNTCLFKNS